MWVGMVVIVGFPLASVGNNAASLSAALRPPVSFLYAQHFLICATLLQYIYSLENPLVRIILLLFINFNSESSSRIVSWLGLCDRYIWLLNVVGDVEMRLWRLGWRMRKWA